VDERVARSVPGQGQSSERATDRDLRMAVKSSRWSANDRVTCLERRDDRQPRSFDCDPTWSSDADSCSSQVVRLDEVNRDVSSEVSDRQTADKPDDDRLSEAESTPRQRQHCDVKHRM